MERRGAQSARDDYDDAGTWLYEMPLYVAVALGTVVLGWFWPVACSRRVTLSRPSGSPGRDRSLGRRVPTTCRLPTH